MRLSISKSKNAQSLYVIDDVTVGNKRTSVVVESLGTISELQEKLQGQDPIVWAKEYVQSLREAKKLGEETIIQKFSSARQIPKNEVNSFQGGYLFLEQIYHLLGLHKIAQSIALEHKIEYNLDAILSRLLYTRILNPSSKHSSYECSKQYLEGPDFELHQVYRALSLLAAHSSAIETQVYRNSLKAVDRNTKVLYYDCTNYFFEIEQEDDLRKYGQSKQHQPSPLVQMGLFMDGSGLPLAFSINPGNQNEQPTLKPLEKRIIKDFELSKFIVCTDAGLGSISNRKFNAIQDRAYVVTQSIKQLVNHLKSWALDPSGWSLSSIDAKIDIRKIHDSPRNNRIYFKERWIKENGLEQHLVVTYSPKYKHYQKNIRDQQVLRAEKLATSPSKVNRKRSNDPKRFIESTHCTSEGEVAEKELLQINADKIAEEARYDGFYAVCTNVDGEVEQILAINKQRWRIEACFRTLKSEFKARPVYLRNEDRIHAHFLTCFLSLLIFRILELNLGEEYTESEIISTLRGMSFRKLGNKGYIPAYTRTDLTDQLHEVAGIHTDREIISSKMMKNIFKQVKEGKKLRKKDK